MWREQHISFFTVSMFLVNLAGSLAGRIPYQSSLWVSLYLLQLELKKVPWQLEPEPTKPRGWLSLPKTRCQSLRRKIGSSLSGTHSWSWPSLFGNGTVAMRSLSILQSLAGMYCWNTEHCSNEQKTHKEAWLLLMLGSAIHQKGSYVFNVDSTLPIMCEKNDSLC